jgi:hypothetical protein
MASERSLGRSGGGQIFKGGLSLKDDNTYISIEIHERPWELIARQMYHEHVLVTKTVRYHKF